MSPDLFDSVKRTTTTTTTTKKLLVMMDKQKDFMKLSGMD